MTDLLTGPGPSLNGSTPAAAAAGHDRSPPDARRVVLDTSVLVSDPDAVFAFAGTEIVVPLVVIEELDHLKSRHDDVGRAARAAIRTLEELRVANDGDIGSPCELPDGASVWVDTDNGDIDLAGLGLDPATPDNRIIATALAQRRAAEPVAIVSNDAALRIKAAQLGLGAHEHHGIRARRQHHRSAGWRTVETAGSVIDGLYERGSVASEAVDGPHTANEHLVLRSGQQSVLARSRGRELVALTGGLEAWGLRPRSKEQQFALDLLLDPEVAVVALDGEAGTGKTILSLAAGLEQVMEAAHFDKLAVYRPVVPVGKSDVGFLPGTLEEKLGPWMTAVTDALVALTERRSHADARAVIEEMTAREKLSLETVTFLRGRSLTGTYVVVDEAQNLEPTTLKTILTRVGEGTKVVFTGDTSQIDAPYVSEHTNAIAVLIDVFEGQPCFGHVRLTSCERSEVASLAARIL